jgi:hypothetical protein
LHWEKVQEVICLQSKAWSCSIKRRPCIVYVVTRYCYVNPLTLMHRRVPYLYAGKCHDLKILRYWKLFIYCTNRSVRKVYLQKSLGCFLEIFCRVRYSRDTVWVKKYRSVRVCSEPSIQVPCDNWKSFSFTYVYFWFLINQLNTVHTCTFIIAVSYEHVQIRKKVIRFLRYRNL